MNGLGMVVGRVAGGSWGKRQWLVWSGWWLAKPPDSTYCRVGAVGDWALLAAQNLEKRALHWWRRVLLFIPV